MELQFRWIGGAAWTLHVGRLTIACDPVLCPRGAVQDYGFFKTTRLQDPAELRASIHPAMAVWQPGDSVSVRA